MSVVEGALGRISAAAEGADAFRRVRGEQALAEARDLKDRRDLQDLPLAGVPIAVKDVVAVTGEYVGWGSQAGSLAVSPSDHDVVARLRAAGAVIVGLTHVPELCLWPMTDVPGTAVRNPWNPDYTAGGSSGGSAAAVAAGVVPLAHGTDALGSVRSPAAICGLVGVTPGTGTVPSADSSHWSGMYSHGPLATTVSDAALLLSVLADRPELARIAEPGALRVATSVQLPGGLGKVPQEFTEAVGRTAKLLEGAGHSVTDATPKYGRLSSALLTRWLAGPGEPAEAFDRKLLQPRTRRHLRAGALLRRLRLGGEGPKRAWIARAEAFFADHDVLVTPMLATLAPKAEQWNKKGWLANILPAVQLTSFLGPWDLAGYPTMSVPAGQHSSGLPIAVQLVAPPGGESRLLAVAAQLENLAPWPTTTTRISEESHR
ncbi:amidase family protein [Streptomyces kunmingensis]|uniref:Amidase family protein n=1 Tax=Streptomyces kunmingensis TaxID=68225 RepID=A0ABU6CA00_9ACTN|nr:amidase family protein [Streptomyces kunmingensis]MEB3961452.1 amidase family protein [Streptomyces kunmingensis]